MFCFIYSVVSGGRADLVSGTICLGQKQKLSWMPLSLLMKKYASLAYLTISKAEKWNIKRNGVSAALLGHRVASGLLEAASSMVAGVRQRFLASSSARSPGALPSLWRWNLGIGGTGPPALSPWWGLKC